MDISLLFKYYYRPLCLYAMHFVQNISLAEDIVQESFTAFIEKRIDERNISNIRSYFFATVKNQCIKHLKSKNFIENGYSHEELENLYTEEFEDQSFLEAQLWTSIDSLPKRCREIFLLNKRDGLKYKEIAELLNISTNTVDNQIQKALKVLRGAIKNTYNTIVSFFN